jgi:hypothetical protein
MPARVLRRCRPISPCKKTRRTYEETHIMLKPRALVASCAACFIVVSPLRAARIATVPEVMDWSMLDHASRVSPAMEPDVRSIWLAAKALNIIQSGAGRDSTIAWPSQGLVQKVVTSFLVSPTDNAVEVQRRIARLESGGKALPMARSNPRAPGQMPLVALSPLINAIENPEHRLLLPAKRNKLWQLLFGPRLVKGDPLMREIDVFSDALRGQRLDDEAQAVIAAAMQGSAVRSNLWWNPEMEEWLRFRLGVKVTVHYEQGQIYVEFRDLNARSRFSANGGFGHLSKAPFQVHYHVAGSASSAQPQIPAPAPPLPR